MKFLKLRRKLKNSALAVLFAVAVMFVMPATVFADDTNVIDDMAANVEDENNIENADSAIVFDAEQPAVTESFIYYTEPEKPEITDSVIQSGNYYSICCNCGKCGENCGGTCCYECEKNYYGVCCDSCSENCNGACCDMCVINSNSTDNINVPDNFEYVFGGGLAEGTDASDYIGGAADGGLEEEGSFRYPYGEAIDAPTDGFTYTNSDEDIIPAFPIEPIFPDNNYNYDIVPENPEEVYRPEFGNESADGDLTWGADEDSDNENDKEIISDDDFTDEAEETISDENSEISDDFNSENSDNITDEENTESENSDNTTDEENPESENSDNITDEENPDSENSDNVTNEDDESIDPDDAAVEEELDNSDEENSDGSDIEALEADDNPTINVVLPASIYVMVNPYDLNVVDDSGFRYSILSPEYSIKNYSNCDVSIVATVSASTEGGIILSPYELSGNETEFMAFAYLEATNESGVYSGNYNNSANQIAFLNEAASKEILTLADGSNGETVGYFRINGQAVLRYGEQYSDQAMINMLITFDINPVSKSAVSNDAGDKETENAENTESFENVQELAA